MNHDLKTNSNARVPSQNQKKERDGAPQTAKPVLVYVYMHVLTHVCVCVICVGGLMLDASVIDLMDLHLEVYIYIYI